LDDEAKRWRRAAMVHAALFKALDSERLMQDWNLVRFGRAAKHDARGGRLRAIVHDELGERERARAIYLEHTPPDQRELELLIRLEAWPQAANRLEDEPPAGGWLGHDQRGQVLESQERYDEACAQYDAAVALVEGERARAG